jgi:hypothetical protein
MRVEIVLHGGSSAPWIPAANAHELGVVLLCAVPARVVSSFVDAEVNGVLDLDTEREVALVLVPLGHTPGLRPALSPAVQPLALATIPLSKTEVEYPAIRAMHAASSLTDRAEVKAWRGSLPPVVAPQPAGAFSPLHPQDEDTLPQTTIEEVILRRGSTRHFAQRPISFGNLHAP